MSDWVKRSLTKRVIYQKSSKKDVIVLVPPSETVVLAVKLLLALLFSMTGLEVVHLIVLHAWNIEIFTAITGLGGTVTGIFLGQKA